MENATVRWQIGVAWESCLAGFAVVTVVKEGKNRQLVATVVMLSMVGPVFAELVLPDGPQFRWAVVQRTSSIFAYS